MRGITTNALCEQAVLRIAKGDLSALSVLYECVGKLLFAIAYSILEDYQLAEDALHDTFLKVAEQAGSYRKHTNARAWIAAVCRNTALSKRKRQNREIPDAEPLSADDRGTSAEGFWELADMLSALAAPEKEVVVLKAVWGLTHSQIAQILNISPENSRQRYKRALKKLKAAYGKAP